MKNRKKHISFPIAQSQYKVPTLKQIKKYQKNKTVQKVADFRQRFALTLYKKSI